MLDSSPGAEQADFDEAEVIMAGLDHVHLPRPPPAEKGISNTDGAQRPHFYRRKPAGHSEENRQAERAAARGETAAVEPGCDEEDDDCPRASLRLTFVLPAVTATGTCSVDGSRESLLKSGRLNLGSSSFSVGKRATLWQDDNQPWPRRIASRISRSIVFRTLILVGILSNAVILAIQTPSNDLSDATNQALDGAELGLCLLFSIEATVKIVAVGFIQAPLDDGAAYMHSGWNVLDFVIVVSQWCTYIITYAADLQHVGVKLASIRVLRVLKFLKSYPAFRDIDDILVTFAESMGHSANILAFLAFVLVMAGIISVQTFKGKLHYRCSAAPPRPNLTEYSYDYDFDPGMGLGIRHTHCWPDTTHADDIRDRSAYVWGNNCPSWCLQNASRPHACECYQSMHCNDMEMCYKFGNPGWGNISFDNILSAWSSIFVMMAQLYWWELAYRIEDASRDIDSFAQGSAWIFCFLVVVFLSFLWANMFVALVTTYFGTARDISRQRRFNRERSLISITIMDAVRPPSDPDRTVHIHMRGRSTIGEMKEKMEALHGVPRTGTVAFLGAMREKIILTEEARKLILVPARDLNGNTSSELSDADLLAPLFKDAADQRTKIDRRKRERELLNSGYREPCANAEEDDRGNLLPAVWFVHNPGFYRCKWATYVIRHPVFESILMFVILLNTIVLATEHFSIDGDHREWDQWQQIASFTFTAIYLVEFIVKLIGAGASNYFAGHVKLLAKSKTGVEVTGILEWQWNALDFFLVFLSAVHAFAQGLFDGIGSFRMVRLFVFLLRVQIGESSRLMNFIHPLRDLADRVLGSGRSIANLVLFIFFAVTVLAIVGMQLLGGNLTIEMQDNGSPNYLRRNLESFGRAWLLVFQTLTGDDWSNQMYTYMNPMVIPVWIVPFLFFVLSFIFTNYLLMNLFIAVILENFERKDAEKRDEQCKIIRDTWRAEIEYLLDEAEVERTKHCLLVAPEISERQQPDDAGLNPEDHRQSVWASLVDCLST
eukprot:SAG31_NODE_2981_length_4829_cov_1.746089_3_plen_1001_part_01